MANRRLIDYNPVLDIARYFHYHGNGKFTIETVQNVSAIVAANKRQMTDGEKRFGPGMMHHVGRIPLNILYDSLQIGDDSSIRKFLNRSEHRAWKTKPVIV